MKRVVIMASALVCFSVALVCGEDSGGTRLPIFDSRLDARIQGLAGVSVCLPENVMASAENPALCRTLRGAALSSSRISTPMSNNLYALAAGYNSPASRAGIFIQWHQLLVEGIDHTAYLTDSSGNPILDENLDPADTAYAKLDDLANSIHAGAGFSLLSWVQVGASAKAMIRTLDTSTQTGWGMDVGVTFGYPDGPVHLGLAMSDVVPVTWDSGQNERLAIAGVSAKVATIRAAAQIENLVHSTFDRRGSLGLEWQIAAPVCLRAGWSPEYYSFGTGLALGPVRLHYAIVHHVDLGFENPHRITIEYSSGG